MDTIKMYKVENGFVLCDEDGDPFYVFNSFNELVKMIQKLWNQA